MRRDRRRLSRGAAAATARPPRAARLRLRSVFTSRVRSHSTLPGSFGLARFPASPASLLLTGESLSLPLFACFVFCENFAALIATVMII